MIINAEIAIQKNGRKIGSILVPLNSDQDYVYNQAMRDENINQYFVDVTIHKTVYIHNVVMCFFVAANANEQVDITVFVSTKNGFEEVNE